MAERRLVVEICSSDDAILSEYVAMREELMFFVDSQRKSINFMMSVVFGQAGILLLHQDVVVHLARYISLFYLFGLPLVIFSLMLTTLEFTAKILFVADFIHHDVRARYLSKHRLETGFFEWEIYKRNSKRVNKYLMIALDLSKWLIFCLLEYQFGRPSLVALKLTFRSILLLEFSIS
jgi:hypothetical protein